MAYIERTDEEIIAAWEKWLERHPSPDEKHLESITGESWTPRESIAALKRGEQPFKEVMVDTIRKFAKEWNEDPVDLILKNRNQN